MNTGASHQSARSPSAFTLAEVMITMSIFLLVVAAVVATNYFGIRMVQLTEPKLQAGGRIRQMMSRIVADISSAQSVRFGSGDLYSFTGVADGAPKQGSALQIYPSADTNDFIRYYWDAVDRKLKRMTNGASGAVIVADAVANGQVFNGEDAQGNILTNNQNNLAVGLTLQFFQMQGSGMPVSPSNLFKSYQLRTRITHRPR